MLWLNKRTTVNVLSAACKRRRFSNVPLTISEDSSQCSVIQEGANSRRCLPIICSIGRRLLVPGYCARCSQQWRLELLRREESGCERRELGEREHVKGDAILILTGRPGRQTAETESL